MVNTSRSSVQSGIQRIPEPAVPYQAGRQSTVTTFATLAVIQPLEVTLSSYLKHLVDPLIKIPSFWKELPLAARLPHFIHNWRVIAHDDWVLEAIQGYRLAFAHQAVQHHPPRQRSLTPTEASALTQEISNMLEKGAIYPVSPDSPRFLSEMFVVPKKGGNWRPVINLRPLNAFLLYEHFKMEGIHLLRNLLHQGDLMAKVDLKDAYFSVAMDSEAQKFLGFQWKDKTYQFRSLPFGLASASRVFTKLLRPVAAALRARGLRMIIYLDDILLLASSREEMDCHLVLLLHTLTTLGFVINTAKSILKPTQRLEFLGFVADSADMSLALPKDKVRKIRKECQEMLQAQEVPIINIARLLGHLSASIQAVFPAPLHFRFLQADKNQALQTKSAYSQMWRHSLEAKEELEW